MLLPEDGTGQGSSRESAAGGAAHRLATPTASASGTDPWRGPQQREPGPRPGRIRREKPLERRGLGGKQMEKWGVHGQPGTLGAETSPHPASWWLRHKRKGTHPGSTVKDVHESTPPWGPGSSRLGLWLRVRVRGSACPANSSALGEPAVRRAGRQVALPRPQGPLGRGSPPPPPLQQRGGRGGGRGWRWWWETRSPRRLRVADHTL